MGQIMMTFKMCLEHVSAELRALGAKKCLIKTPARTPHPENIQRLNVDDLSSFPLTQYFSDEGLQYLKPLTIETTIYPHEDLETWDYTRRGNIWLKQINFEAYQNPRRSTHLTVNIKLGPSFKKLPPRPNLLESNGKLSWLLCRDSYQHLAINDVVVCVRALLSTANK